MGTFNTFPGENQLICRRSIKRIQMFALCVTSTRSYFLNDSRFFWHATWFFFSCSHSNIWYNEANVFRMTKDFAKSENKEIVTHQWSAELRVTPYNINIYGSDYEVLIFSMCSAHSSQSMGRCMEYVPLLQSAVLLIFFLLSAYHRPLLRCVLKKGKKKRRWIQLNGIIVDDDVQLC